MAEETLNTSAGGAMVAAPEVVAAVVPPAEEVTKVKESKAVEEVTACDKDTPPPEAEEEEKPKTDEEKEKISESASFKEESNVAGELPDPQKKALDEFKALVQEALNKHEFSAPPAPEKPPTKAVEEESKKDETTPEAAVVVEETPAKPVEEETKKDDPTLAAAAAETSEPPVECKTEKEATPIKEEVVEEVKTETPESEAAKEVEKKVITEEETTPPPQTAALVVEEPPVPVEPEEVSIWGIPLLADERSDVILLKFLRARDFKVKEAFAMLKSVVTWRKEFGIEELLTEDLGTEQEKVVYMHGTDKEGHPVCYNAYSEYGNKELYNETFSTEEKRTKYIKWRIQFLEKCIRKLDFSPDGICTIVQVIDFKNSPGPFQWELRQVTKQALQLFQDNYPEFVAKQVFINVPFLYLAFYKVVNPFFTQRTKSKFVFAGPSKTAETLFKYIAPELVPVQYGGLSREGEQEFTSSDSVTEEIIKPASKHCVEFAAPETCTLVWEARVVDYGITYGAEFVPAAEDGYTVIIQKSRKISATTDEPVLCGSFKCGEPGKVVLTFDNQTSKKKKVLYRSKTKVSSD